MSDIHASAEMIARRITLTGLALITVVVLMSGADLRRSMALMSVLLSCETLALWHLGSPGNRFPLVFNLIEPPRHIMSSKRLYGLFSVILAATFRRFAKALAFPTLLAWILSAFTNFPFH